VTISELRRTSRLWRSRRDLPYVFIIGTGRSGTHLLAEVLAGDPGYAVLVEKQPLFRWSTAMALDSGAEATYFDRWVRRLCLEQCAAAPRTIVEKSHPNIWITERLATALPNSLFLVTRRKPHPTIASMVQHGGFLYSDSRWRSFPLPNRLLGIDQDQSLHYSFLSPVEQLALRWISNERQRARLQPVLGPRMFEVDYETLLTDPGPSIDRLAAFLGSAGPLVPPSIDSAPLNKWQGVLSGEQIAAIDAMLCRHGFSAEAVGLSR
jgi:hypothetical protein